MVPYKNPKYQGLWTCPWLSRADLLILPLFHTKKSTIFVFRFFLWFFTVVQNKPYSNRQSLLRSTKLFIWFFSRKPIRTKKSKYCIFDIKFLSHFLSILAKRLSLQRFPKNQLHQNVARSILRRTMYRALSKNVRGPSSISHKMTKSRLILIQPSTALVHFDFYTS